MMVTLKFVHVGAIALWAGALLMLPWLMAQRQRAGSGETLHTLHRTVRMLYVQLASPTAFIAIATGTALILLRPTQAPWFSAKLAAVGLLAILHVGHGLIIPRLFQDGGRLPRVAGLALWLGNLLAILAVLWLVLWRPDVPLFELDMRPGGLYDWLQPRLPQWLAPLIDPGTS